MDYPALMDPRNMGILAAAFQGLQASGPSRMPVSLGQVIGQGGMAGIGAFQQANEAQRKYEQTQALINLEKQKTQQSALQGIAQIEQLNMQRAWQGLPPIQIPGMGPSGPAGAPQAPGMGVGSQTLPPPPVGAPGPMAQAPQAAPQPVQPATMESPIQRAQRLLPPDAFEAVKALANKGDFAGIAGILKDGARRTSPSGVDQIWNPQAQKWEVDPTSENAIRTRKLLEADIADASAPGTFTFGTGMNARTVRTTRAIENALTTGIAPNAEVATAAVRLAAQNGAPSPNISIRGENSPESRGLTNSQPTPEEIAQNKSRETLLTGLAGEVKNTVVNTQAAAAQSVDTIDTVRRIQSAIDKGNVNLGPTATIRNKIGQIAQTIGVGGDTDAEKLVNTRNVMRGLAQFTVGARKSLKGQGQVSDYEGRLIGRAESGEIDDFTLPELKDFLKTTERLGRQVHAEHNRVLGIIRNSKDESVRELASYFDVPDLPKDPNAPAPSLSPDGRKLYEKYLNRK